MRCMWRVISTVLLVAVSLSAVPLRAQGSTDDAAVRAVVRQYVDARELRDRSAIDALFTAEADHQTCARSMRSAVEQYTPAVGPTGPLD